MEDRRTTTVVFLDIVGSTRVAADLGDARFRELLLRFARIVRGAARANGGHEEDHAGDGFFLTFRDPAPAIAFARRATEDVRPLGIELRVGIHTGETERVGKKRQGIAVVIGARVMALAGPGEILVTSTTKELATGGRFGFEPVAAHELKGVPGTWQVWAVATADGRALSRPLPPREAAERLRSIEPTGQRRRDRRWLVAIGGMIALAAIAIATGAASGPDAPPEPSPSAPVDVPPGTVLQLDPETLAVRSAIRVVPLQLGTTVRHTVHPLVAGQGSVWVIRGKVLIQLDPVDGDERGRPALGIGNPVSINVASGADAVWVMADVELVRINPGSGEAGTVLEIERPASPTGTPTWTTDVAATTRHVWIGTSDGHLVRFDAGTRRTTRTVVPGAIDAIAAGPDSVWTTDVVAGTITPFDPRSLRPGPSVEIQGGADDVAVDGPDAWVLSRASGQVSPVLDGDPSAPIRVGSDPTSIAIGFGAVWVGDEDGLLRRIDVDTLQLTSHRIGGSIRAIAVDDDTDSLWVDVR
ncbi:MAG TPA: adenylate/guanylate cyclase domain-containing protein [Actinomycetota bacterium]|nr:adenylate/guanylate cyclase domain-containing protein [Actinomycetota bacterium]